MFTWRASCPETANTNDIGHAHCMVPGARLYHLARRGHAHTLFYASSIFNPRSIVFCDCILCPLGLLALVIHDPLPLDAALNFLLSLRRAGV